MKIASFWFHQIEKNSLLNVILIVDNFKIGMLFFNGSSLLFLQQVEKVMQHRELEQKLADAKLEQASAYLAEEQEKSRKEHLVVRSISSMI